MWNYHINVNQIEQFVQEIGMTLYKFVPSYVMFNKRWRVNNFRVQSDLGNNSAGRFCPWTFISWMMTVLYCAHPHHLADEGPQTEMSYISVAYIFLCYAKLKKIS